MDDSPKQPTAGNAQRTKRGTPTTRPYVSIQNLDGDAPSVYTRGHDRSGVGRSPTTHNRNTSGNALEREIDEDISSDSTDDATPLVDGAISLADRSNKAKLIRDKNKARNNSNLAENGGERSTWQTSPTYISKAGKEQATPIYMSKAGKEQATPAYMSNTGNEQASPDSMSKAGNEQARLLSVRRLDTPEPRRRGEADDDSDKSSTESGPTGEPEVLIPKRYILAIMMMIGFMNMYAIRVNINVAIGAMVHNHTLMKGGKPVTVMPEFNWSSRLQGFVLGSFYYGYMVLQIPGGYFAMRFGGTRIFGFGILVASILTLLTPPMARYSVWALVILRILEGLALGVMLPCNHQIWSSWAPLQERTVLCTIALAGMNIGTVVTMPLTGLLTKYGWDGGWASVFYCFGMFGLIWYIAWLLVVHKTPSSHPTISKRERTYIESNTAVRKSMKVPWKLMLTSKAVWAVVVGNVANDWGLYTILIGLPLFLMDIMHFNVQTMGFLASLPFLLKAIVGPLGGTVADVLRSRYLSTANVRRIFYIAGAVPAGIMIVIAGYSSSPAVAVGSMCAGVAMSGLLHSGYEVNILDIAPSLSGIVMGISNTLGTTTGFISPLIIGILTETKHRSDWVIVFWITFAVYAIGTALFCVLLSGEAEPWAVEQDDEEDESGN